MVDVLVAMGVALTHIFTAEALLFLVFGSIVGLFFGALPGIGAVVVISLLIPFSWGMNPMTAFVLFGAAGGASCSFGGSIPAILLNTPGTPPQYVNNPGWVSDDSKGEGWTGNRGISIIVNLRRPFWATYS